MRDTEVSAECFRLKWLWELNDFKSCKPAVFSAACWQWWGPVPGPRRPVAPPAGPVFGPGFRSSAPAGLPCWPQRAGGLWTGWCSPDPASTPWSPPASSGQPGWAPASPGSAAALPAWTGGGRNRGSRETEVMSCLKKKEKKEGLLKMILAYRPCIINKQLNIQSRVKSMFKYSTSRKYRTTKHTWATKCHAIITILH